VRPRFKLPDKISAVWWPRFVKRLEDQGIWDAVLQRINDEGYPAVASDAAEVLQELRDMERAEMSNEIDLEKARQDLERAKDAGENDDAAQEAVRRAEARIRAVERAS